MNHWTEYDPATDDILIHIIGKNTTPEQALAMLAGLNIDANVVIDGNKDFTITLEQGKEPVVNYAKDQGGQGSVPTTPDTGASTTDGNHAAAAVLPLASIALGILSIGSFSFAGAKIRRYFRWMK